MKALVLGLLLLATQGAAEVNSAAISGARPPDRLSEFGFFDDLATMAPAAGVVPYDISAPLFSDYADKDRYIYTPEPAAAEGPGLLNFPVGAALIKTFRYGPTRIETRVLMHQEGGWTGFAYLWNDDGTDAELKIAGADLSLDTDHGPVAYHVPNANQCKACHFDASGRVSPIGPKLRNLSHGDQLTALVAAGVLDRVPASVAPTPDYRDGNLPISDRARSYLDANCGHCHAPGLPADTSGLYLNWEEDRPLHLGVLKRPVAAGRGSGGLEFDIVPGDPAASILLFRLGSTDPGVMMPEIGRSVIHAEGAALISQWIAELE